jgi:FkbM family methyltransferase
MTTLDSLLTNLISALPTVAREHVPGSSLYALLRQVARAEVEKLFSGTGEEPHVFGPFGPIVFPYFNMGAVDSLDLFGLDELIIFSFYWANRHRYKHVVDAGANIGLHSLVMSCCGFQVTAFEPDPKHFELLSRNMALNHCSSVEIRNAAVSSTDGELEFIRVVGNTTGSHLAGSKANPYGELQRFPVPVHAIGPFLKRADLLKMDVEGHEKQIVLSTCREDWMNTDAMMEVQCPENAAALYEHFSKLKISMFSQKSGWQKVRALRDLPTSHREGSLFVTCGAEMPWQSGYGGEAGRQ